jgi:diguanylate cyclase (GGDEF)-like protein
VLFLDLDNFKTVNDSLGHHAGDQLLCEVADRLAGAVGHADLVARQGGDEFVVLLTGTGGQEDAARVAGKLLDLFGTPMLINGHKVAVSCSIGIGLFPGDGVTADELIRHADVAMYHAKDSGRRNYQFFAPGMSRRSFEALDQEHLLRDALAQEQFVLHYQPQVDATDGRLTGMEALVRWQHPSRGLVGPADFIPFAEQRGLIAAIGRWVVAQACRQLKAWHDGGHPRVPVAVNLSAIEFRQRDLVSSIARALQETGLEPRYLEIELTESALLEHGGNIGERLHALKALGVRLAIDDFGTGYSSLAYLKRYPIDRLKIDRSFVQDTPQDPDDVAIVTAILQMAHALKLATAAEGVETIAQLALLQRLGCGDCQGFLVSRPMAPHQMEQFLRGPGITGWTP